MTPDNVDRTPVRTGPWLRRSRRTVYENPWLVVWHDEVVRPDGEPGIYGAIHFRTAAVGVVAVDERGRILLVGQYRYMLDGYSWEIPEGGVDEGEPLLEGARRELREETGFEATAWRELCRVTMSNSVTDERGTLFVATGLRPGHAEPEGTEDITVRWVTLDQALAMIDAGEIHDLLSIAGIGRFAVEVLRAR